MQTLPVVILAAGRGRRLAPLTDELPKCLLPIGGSSPLERLLEALVSPGAPEIVIVTGHAHERIEAFLEAKTPQGPVRCLYNPDYDRTNNIVSVWLARERCAEGFVLVNSDVVCHPRIVEQAVSPAHDGSFLVVDPTLPPRPEAMKVRYAAGRLAEIGKEIEPGRADGEYIGLARFDRSGARTFLSHVEAILDRGGRGEWYEAAIGSAAREFPIGRRTTGGLPWIEIDDPGDLRRAGAEILPAIGRGGPE